MFNGLTVPGQNALLFYLSPTPWKALTGPLFDVFLAPASEKRTDLCVKALS
jgi:hypothetical protein